MSREGSLIKNTAIITIGKICTQLITFFLLPLYTSILSTQEYGIIDLLITVTSLCLPFFTLQLEQGLFRTLIEVRGKKEEETIIVSSGITVVTFQVILYTFIYWGVSHFIQNDYKVYLIVNIIAFSYSTILLQIARGFGDNKTYAMGSFLSALFTIMFNILFLVGLRLRVEGMLLGTIMGHIVCVVYLTFALKIYQYIRIRKFDKDTSKQLLKYSIPLIPNAISWWIFNVSDRVVVSAILGVAQNGILSAASKFSTVYIVFFNIFHISWTESVSVNINDKDIKDFFNKTFNVALRFFVSVGFMIIACMPFVYPFILNERYSRGYVLVPMMILASLLNVVVGLISAIYVAKKNTKAIANTSIISAVLNIIIHLALIHRVGLFAASISTFASYFIMCIYRLQDIKKRYFKIEIEPKFVFVTLCTFLVIIICYYMSGWKIHILGLAVTAVYAVVMNRNIVEFLRKFITQKIKG